MSIRGDVHEHPNHPFSLQHNLAPAMSTASTKLILSLLRSAAWKQDREARVVALFPGSAKHGECVSMPSTSYEHSVSADLARCRERHSFRSTHLHSIQADAHALMPPKPIQLSLPGLPMESWAPEWTLNSQKQKSTALSGKSFWECRANGWHTGFYRHTFPRFLASILH